MRELELKFVLDEACERTLRARLASGLVDHGPAQERDLRSIYYDSPEYTLRKNRMSLRLRHDGKGWVQTVKNRKRLNGGLAQADEFDAAVPEPRIDLRAIPDKAARKRIKAAIGAADLGPVCETRIHRTAFELRPDNRTRAELAIDVGEIRAGDQVALFREAEIELLEGSPRMLFRLARALMPEGGTRFSRRSKATRGYMLAAEGRLDPPLAPRPARPVALKPGQTVEAAAQAILRECLDQVAANIAVCVALDDPEGPHQLRIGLRRLRAALALLRRITPDAEAERLAGEAGWLARLAGGLRDLQVLRDGALRPVAAAHPDMPGFAPLLAAVEERLTAAWAQLRGALAEDRLQALLLDLACYTELRGWLARDNTEQTERLAEPLSGFAGRLLERQWRRLRRQGAGLEGFTDEQRHDFRKALKKLRYTAELLSPALPEPRAQGLAARLTALQGGLGVMTDAAVARALLAGPEAPCPGDPAAQQAVGLVLAAQDRQAQAAWLRVADLWQQPEAAAQVPA